MKEKKIFEIPIYSMSEMEFDKRYKKKKESLSYESIDESSKRDINTSLFPTCLWKYNQIIGYITISVERNEVILGLYCSRDKKYLADTKIKHFIQNWDINGTHFYVSDETALDEIKKKILEMLKFIEEVHLHPKHPLFYIDYLTFYNIFDYVDIKQIMKTI